MLPSKANIAGTHFLLSLAVIAASQWLLFVHSELPLIFSAPVLLAELLTLIITLKVFQRDETFQISVRASLLGAVFAVGLLVRLTAPEGQRLFGCYMCVMAAFHFSEFFVMSIIRPKEASTDSFVINHSPQYVAAAVTSWLEFFVEGYFYPGMKQVYWLSNIGLSICIFGEVLRKTAMLTAGPNFHHLVQCEKSPDHKLVTTGVYSWFRHPSYVGWFYWSVGTQVLLLNPLCVPAYVVASWFFFQSRVYIEEITLLNFFGQSYCDYQARVGTGLPFIDGYRIR